MHRLESTQLSKINGGTNNVVADENGNSCTEHSGFPNIMDLIRGL